MTDRSTTLRTVQNMEAALAAGETEMARYFHEDFTWRGNRGYGTKLGLAAFQKNWQAPFRAAFSDRVFKTEKFLADGDWAACFGICEATHSAPFMGVPATGKRVKIPYMDFWRVEDGRIADNPVSVDFAAVLEQLGVDIFNGEGWEKYDRGDDTPPDLEDQK